MSEVLVLPFFNRYSVGTVSQSPSGIIAYGSRGDICVIDVLGNRALILDSKSIQLAHRGRITGVSFCKKSDVELLATVGDEGVIKVWDLETKTCVKETKSCGGVAEWAHNSNDVLFFVSDSKHLAKWFLSTDTVRKIKTESEMPITILASNETYLAAGHHNGTITIFDVIQENILQKLKAHSQEILSLSWNPTSPELLLTASYDLTLRLWKIGEDKPVNSYYVPVGRVRYEDKKKVNIVGTWHPRNHDMAICSNFRGEWGEVCLSKGETPKFSTLSYDLNSKGFILCFSFPKKTAQGIQNLLIIFDTYKLTVWNVCEKKLELQVPMLMGFIYGLSFSSINPNLLAIGNGDGTLKIWNAQAESAEKNMMGIYVHYRAKIMTAAWHPLYENIIAYGTDEGRVAIIDLFKKKSIYTFETYHSGKVYTVCWGPFKQGKGPKENEYFVYSCGSGTIFINRLHYSKEPAYDFDDFANLPSHLESNKKTYSEINWKPDFSYVLIGSYKGFIDLYNDELVFLNRYNVEMKSIECLTWHPERTYESPDRSPLEFWFAACGNDADIYLFNSTKTLEQSQGEDDSKWESKRLVGHKKRVVRVCWSQHNDGFLASSSRDGSVLVSIL
ncbi:gem-associated protein 5 [Trichonephila inaurata madagascariensis]|uniref:Gem-associated protein 5 n=1 Tax=Trichonephila inaurata madagascariensis TaxID=2747483 RepID=A0A8X6J6W0_9ARAC|nr:gem-associated protein 5 [Trichonephila inaurata madagascariensis]